MNTTLLLLAGLVLLIVGAEMLIRGSSRLAQAIGISPLVVGLVIVAYGTSMPEIIVSAKSALSGQVDIALGNVVGSNIFNVLFILGLSALVVPLTVKQQLIRLDVPIMIGVSLLAIVLSLDGNLSRLDGVLMLSGIVAYTVFLIRSSKRESDEAVKEEYAKEYGQSKTKNKKYVLIQVSWVLVGLGTLIWGARWFVDGAVVLAQNLGVSELIIGLTIVAAGTSLPEVAASVMASVRGERDIAVGNVVGSNIYNILAVLGIASVIAPNGIVVTPVMLNFDMPVMLAVAVACLPIFFTGSLISRWEGALFLAYYAAYTTYLIFKSQEHDHLEPFAYTMLVFVIPITVITLLVLGYRQYERNRSGRIE